MSKYRIDITLLLLGLLTLVVPITPGNAQTLTTELVADGFSNPVYVTAPPGDTERLFVVEVKSGLIKIIKNGSVLATPFVDLSSVITTDANERGLLGLAFHPNYESNGYFFVDYTGANGDTYVMRYKVSGGNPDLADPGSVKQILAVSQPFNNHNGGMIAFGPEGYLFIGMGDGGSGGDPGNRAQNGSLLLGKILRLDVDTPDGTPYTIPGDNPFVNDPNVRDEIWATGVRNPWRYSFDRGNGDLYIADVGQSNWEEIDFQGYGTGGGQNYGWRCYEGNHPYNTTDCGPSGDYVFPIQEYDHSLGCSITGGYVYRGCANTALQGTYFYGDFCSGRIWSFQYDGSAITDFTERTAELDPSGSLSIDMISSFGEDGRGELYIVDYSDGEIYRIVRSDGNTDCSITVGCGDVNGSGTVDVLDIIFMIKYKFKGGPAPNDLSLADVNSDGTVNVIDIITMIDYKFKNGDPLNCPTA